MVGFFPTSFLSSTIPRHLTSFSKDICVPLIVSDGVSQFILLVYFSNPFSNNDHCSLLEDPTIHYFQRILAIIYWLIQLLVYIGLRVSVRIMTFYTIAL